MKNKNEFTGGSKLTLNIYPDGNQSCQMSEEYLKHIKLDIRDKGSLAFYCFGISYLCAKCPNSSLKALLSWSQPYCTRLKVKDSNDIKMPEVNRINPKNVSIFKRQASCNMKIIFNPGNN